MSDKIVQFRIPGNAMSQVEGSELYNDSSKYDPEDPNVVLAHHALIGARMTRVGKGQSYLISAVPTAAEVIRDYFQTQGEIHLGGMSDPEDRAAGRLYLKVAERIKAAMASGANQL